MCLPDLEEDLESRETHDNVCLFALVLFDSKQNLCHSNRSKEDLESRETHDSVTASDLAENYAVLEVETNAKKDLLAEVLLTVDQTSQELQVLKEEVGATPVFRFS